MESSTAEIFPPVRPQYFIKNKKGNPDFASNNYYRDIAGRITQRGKRNHGMVFGGAD